MSFLSRRKVGIIVSIVLLVASAAAVTPTATTTSLAVVSGGTTVTTVSAKSLVTLTATVTAGSTTIKQGQVNFCDGSAHCTDIHLLGTAQITGSGTATLKLRPAAGTYTYKAEFLGTPKTTIPYAPSSSAKASLVVTGKSETITTITPAGNPGNYTITGRVYGFSKSTSLTAPSGMLSFESSTTDSILASGSLGAASSPHWATGDVQLTSNASGAVVGDFDGDGNLDLAIGSLSFSVNSYLGDGQGNFSAPPKVSTFSANGYNPMLSADFNGDGIPDLLLGPYTGPDMAVALGNGDGTFTLGSTVASSYGTQPVVSADFNGDGIADLLTFGGACMGVFVGKGDGSFTVLPTDLSTCDGVFDSLVVGDFNGDGISDVAGVASAGGVTVSVYFGNGDGTFKAGPTTTVSTSFPAFEVFMAVADFNADGKPDLAVPSASGLSILLGNGDGTFTITSASPIAAPGTPLVGDFNGDGIPDLVVYRYPTTSVLLGKGDGTFDPPLTPEISGGGLVGDFNGDGITDIALPDGADVTLSLTALHTSSFQTAGLSINLPTPQDVFASYPGDSHYLSSASSTTLLFTEAAAPVFDPPSGSVITGFQIFTVSSSTPGAEIIYQTSGDIISESGILASGQAVPVVYSGSAGTFAIQATTQARDYGNSATITATYILPSLLSTPSYGAKLTSSSQTFQWETGGQVTAYSLSLGTTPGAQNIGTSGTINTGSATLNNLPTNGETIYATMRSKINGVWYSTSSVFYASGTGTAASITSPANNAKLTSTSATFHWSGGVGISEYVLWVGTSSGAHDLANMVLPGSATSATVSSLPATGETIYVTLNSQNGTTFLKKTYTYSATGTGVAASITSPTNRSTLSGASAAFHWSGGVGVDEYLLWVGSTAGAHDIANVVLPATATSTTVNSIPINGENIYVTLNSLNGATWLKSSDSYIASGHGTAATITSPANKSALTSSNVSFHWSGGVGISEYVLWVGTKAGGHDLANVVLPGTATSANVSGLPTNGSTIYVTLSSLNGATYLANSYTYTAAP